MVGTQTDICESDLHHKFIVNDTKYIKKRDNVFNDAAKLSTIIV